MSYDPIPIKVAFEKIEYDSSSHYIGIKGKTFAEYRNNHIFPEPVLVAFEIKDSVINEDGYEKIPGYHHEALETVFSYPGGEFDIKGKFTGGMILYIHMPGYISAIYDLKNLLGIKKELKNYYKQNTKESKKEEG